jgi:hypothetical protein
LSDNSRALVRHEITAAQREMRDKAKDALPAAGLVGAAAFFGVLSAAASFRLSIRLLEKGLPPATAAFVATAVYGAAADAAGVAGAKRLRELPPLLPAETPGIAGRRPPARQRAPHATDTAARGPGNLLRFIADCAHPERSGGLLGVRPKG